MNRVTVPVAPPSRTTAFRMTASTYSSKLAGSQPPSVSLNSHNYGVQVRTITAFMCISKLAPLQPPSGSLNSHDHGLQVHLQSRSITASKCITKLARLWLSCSHNHSLQVHLQTNSIKASKYICKEQRRVYGDTGVTEVDRVTGSMYSADPRVGRYHPISIPFYHTMKTHTRSFPTFGPTSSLCDFLAPGNCVNPQHWVVSYLLTQLLISLNQNRSLS